MRNFYVDGEIDGRKTHVTGGPQSRNGEMNLTITQRDHGEISTAFTLRSYVLDDGRLCTTVFDRNGKHVTEYITER